MKHKGQTSLVLILLAAVALIFLAVTLNWGRIAPIKTQTTVAAANAAISSASNFASYGQKKIASDLGGRWKYCQHSNIIMAVLTVVIAVVATVLTVITGGAAAPLLYFALALSAASLGLQVLVVQPGLTKLYNKMQTSLSAESQFVENGLITALQGIVSDNGQVTDYFDQNTNGRFGIGS
ncbi:MAG: hypothetical protein HYZ86_01350, partial [Candidatus Omnitrophica bacterium]|nr:hypothetical protein [Candidatus Omnitrophota bacterium]